MAANACVLVLFGASVYFFLQKYSFADFYKRLDTRADIAARYHFETDKADAVTLKQMRDRHLEVLNEERDYLVEATPGANTRQLAAQSGLPEGLIKQALSNGRSNYRAGTLFYSAMKYINGGKTYVVAVSARNYYAAHHLVFLRNLLAAGLVFMFVATSLISIYFSRHVYDPIRAITEKVNSISTDNMHLRLDDYSKDAEIAVLISTFNGLLDRVETTFETHKNFISNASHEIGTPLTTIIGEADVALMKERKPEEYKEALLTILKQAERLSQISESLLFLAQTGYKENKLNFEILRTDELMWETIKLVGKITPVSRVKFDLNLLPENPKKLKVMGNRQLLLLAFTNLLNNACKYSGNKDVMVSIASTETEVVILFKDQGIGIPEEDLPHIYDPFFRASNTFNYDGYGIGLPLTRNIVRIHKGSMQVASVLNEGTTVQLKFPLAIIV